MLSAPPRSSQETTSVWIHLLIGAVQKSSSGCSRQIAVFVVGKKSKRDNSCPQVALLRDCIGTFAGGAQ
jgi:hypothetical protein